ncbi:MAG: HEAT repeat domain-containing protein, partial [Acidobacteriota bacterium]
RALVADLMSKIQDPAAPSTGQGYAFMLDADSRVAASDLHYQATTIRRSFEENPTVLSLTPEEVARLRDEAREENEEELLERFIRILFVILTDCTGSVSTLKLGPVLEQLLEAYWKAEDYRAVCSLLARLQAAAQEAPVPENRELARNAAREFLTEERIRLTFQLVEAGALSLEEALPIWAFIGHETWDLVVDFWWALPEGELRIGVKAFLHKLVSSNPELLRKTLTDEGGGRMRAGLALVNDPLERLYEKELLALAGHPDPSIRLKGVAAAGRIGGPAALETLWKSMESDPAKPVRLLAFRLIAQSDVPQLPSRLRAVVTAPDFASRPLWEREKYVRLLGAVGGESARSLFESWLPQKRWLWQRKDHEAAKLAVVGLGACGAGGLAKVQALAKEGGKLAEIAQKALSSLVVQPGAEAHR